MAKDPKQSAQTKQDSKTSGKKGGAAQQVRGTTTQQSRGAQAKTLFEKFEIPEIVKKQYPDLVPLILETESMNDDERQYWFQILPIMTEDQVNKLREILVNEKKQLQALDKEYEKELKRINTKHVAEWKTFEAKEKREKHKAQEKIAEEHEKTEEQKLLQKLEEL